MDRAEPADLSRARLSVEREKLAVEQAKLAIEREKLALERYKARSIAFAVAVPLLALAIALSVGVWLQFVKARDDVALKAAEIVMAGDDAYASKQKGRALATLFPDRLGPSFDERFEPEKFDDSAKETVARKEQLLGLFVAHPDQRAAVLAVWKVLFPTDQWVAPLQRVIVEDHVAKKAAPSTTPKPKAFGSQPAPNLQNDSGSARGGTEAGDMGFDMPLPSSQQETPSSFVPR